MKLRTLLGGGLLLRTIAKELAGIRVQLTRQADALERLADAHAPKMERATADVLADTGLSYLDANDMMLALDFIRQVEHDQGIAPTEEEVLAYLADEKTIDLHTRLKQRDQEILNRLQSDRT